MRQKFSFHCTAMFSLFLDICIFFFFCWHKPDLLPAAIWEQQQKRKKKFSYSTLGEVNDVIGRKCDALCLPEVLDLIWQKGRVSTHTAIAENLAWLQGGCMGPFSAPGRSLPSGPRRVLRSATLWSLILILLSCVCLLAQWQNTLCQHFCRSTRFAHFLLCKKKKMQILQCFKKSGPCLCGKLTLSNETLEFCKVYWNNEAPLKSTNF